MVIFCSFTTPRNPKNQNFEKMKKILEISSFYTCKPKTTIIWGMVPQIQSETKFFVILGYFLPFYPLKTWKIKLFKKWKNHLEMSSFYTCLPKIVIIWCMLPEIWSVTYIIFLSFWAIFYPLTLLTTKKNQNSIYLDEYLDWSPYINHLSHKLVKANAMIFKLDHYVNEATIKSIKIMLFFIPIFHIFGLHDIRIWSLNITKIYYRRKLCK